MSAAVAKAGRLTSVGEVVLVDGYPLKSDGHETRTGWDFGADSACAL